MRFNASCRFKLTLDFFRVTVFVNPKNWASFEPFLKFQDHLCFIRDDNGDSGSEGADILGGIILICIAANRYTDNQHVAWILRPTGLATSSLHHGDLAATAARRHRTGNGCTRDGNGVLAATAALSHRTGKGCRRTFLRCRLLLPTSFEAWFRIHRFLIIGGIIGAGGTRS